MSSRSISTNSAEVKTLQERLATVRAALARAEEEEVNSRRALAEIADKVCAKPANVLVSTCLVELA